MAGEIAAAVEILNGRKNAIDEEGPVEIGPSQVAAILSGFDLDYDEISDALHSVARFAVQLEAGSEGTPGAVAALCFCDGLAAGLLIAEERQNAGAS